jgi:hypothetical protein
MSGPEEGAVDHPGMSQDLSGPQGGAVGPPSGAGT